MPSIAPIHLGNFLNPFSISNHDRGSRGGLSIRQKSEPTALSPLPTVPRRRKNPVELQEAGKTIKEAISSLHKVLNKPQVVEDDFDRYGKILANKLRKLSEPESLKIMYEIDGLFIKRLNTTPTYSTRPSPIYSSYSEPTQRLQLSHPNTSPIYYVRPESSCTSYSEPDISATRASAVSSTNTIQILSNEIVSPPTDTDYDILGQAFHQA